MNKLMQRAKLFWASLPHKVQAGVVVFVTVAGTTLGKELQALVCGTGGFTWVSLEHDIAAALVAGGIALRTFYMLPNRDMPAQVAITALTATPAAK